MTDAEKEALFSYDRGYKQGYQKAIEDVLNLPKQIYKVYEHGEIERYHVIFVGDIIELEKKNE